MITLAEEAGKITTGESMLVVVGCFAVLLIWLFNSGKK